MIQSSEKIEILLFLTIKSDPIFCIIIMFPYVYIGDLVAEIIAWPESAWCKSYLVLINCILILDILFYQHTPRPEYYYYYHNPVWELATGNTVVPLSEFFYFLGRGCFSSDKLLWDFTARLIFTYWLQCNICFVKLLKLTLLSSKDQRSSSSLFWNIQFFTFWVLNCFS